MILVHRVINHGREENPICDVEELILIEEKIEYCQSFEDYKKSITKHNWIGIKLPINRSKKDPIDYTCIILKTCVMTCLSRDTLIKEILINFPEEI